LKCKKIDDGRPFQAFKFKYPDDPFAYVVSLNVKRRQLTNEQKRETLEKLLKADPEKSNRQIAVAAGVDHKTVGAVRLEAEGRGEIPTRRKAIRHQGAKATGA
jgi:hypothetical protein